MEVKIKHLLADNEKISAFKKESELLTFTKLILRENGDAGDFMVNSAENCLDYIRNYCSDNLQVILKAN